MICCSVKCMSKINTKTHEATHVGEELGSSEGLALELELGDADGVDVGLIGLRVGCCVLPGTGLGVGRLDKVGENVGIWLGSSEGLALQCKRNYIQRYSITRYAP